MLLVSSRERLLTRNEAIKSGSLLANIIHTYLKRTFFHKKFITSVLFKAFQKMLSSIDYFYRYIMLTKVFFYLKL